MNMLGLWPWDTAAIRSKRFFRFMRGDDYLLQARPISPEARKLIRDILRFHPELRLSVSEISTRVLQLRSFFDNPRIKSTSAELREMRFVYQCMLARPDPVARRRKELESLRSLDETSVFNDLSGRLPLPPPPPKILVANLSENPLPRANRPHYGNMDNLRLGCGWYHPRGPGVACAEY